MLHSPLDLSPPQPLKPCHLSSAKKMQDAHLSHMPPVIPVGRECHVLGSVYHVIPYEQHRSVGKNGVVFFKKELGCLSQGYNYGRHLTEAERHDWAVLLSQLC
uniref:Uncharacterized protein n=1 Tax=Opuntia streptacantha TaxID=393608 RepID=A0A7C8ZFR9_OPUST